jgi:hypothetical protein
VTEKEIFNGIFNSTDPASNVLYFKRNIIDIEKNVREDNCKLMGKFIDLDKDNRIDLDSRKLLDDLKNVKIQSKLPSSNIFNFNVSSAFG